MKSINFKNQDLEQIARKRQQLIKYIEELYVLLSYEILKHWKFHFIYAAETLCRVR